MTAVLETVVKQLTDSGIIAQGHLENFIPPKANPASVEELVAQLVKENHLTKFQAVQVAAGKAKSLILGEYTILDKIGAGGMGQVFKALHRRMERTVAIKVLPPGMTKDAAALARFQREVVAAAKLHHPNIVSAYDAGKAGAVHFLVMEFVDGQDLSALVKKNGPFPVVKAVNYVLQAARGLEFAHREGVVHRDIKPANLLLDKKGIVKILDMGLARIDSPGAAQAELTGTGAVMGTVDYMSPEQAYNTKHADARADIYSLGSTLYYLIKGRPIYSGETVVEKIFAHKDREIPSLCSEQSGASQSLELIFKKMVAKRIEDRYQTMTEVIAELKRFDGVLGGHGDPCPVTKTLDKNAIIALKSLDASVKVTKRTNNTHGLSATAHRKIIAWRTVKFLVGISGLGGLLLVSSTFVNRNDLGQRTTPILEVDSNDKITAKMPSQEKAAVITQVKGLTTTSALEWTKKVPPPIAIAPFDAVQAKEHQRAWAKHLGIEIETPNSIGMRMVLIPPGEYMMGGGEEQPNKLPSVTKNDPQVKSPSRSALAERPQHKVVITRPFLMSATEVTVGQFKEFGSTGYRTDVETTKVEPPPDEIFTYLNPGFEVTDDSPASWISWNDATAFSKWISLKEMVTYRLPTEAEWEYACRSGSVTEYYYGDDENEMHRYGWHIKNSDYKTHSVGFLLPNNFGLFDMHGNVHEWCSDLCADSWYSKSPINDPVGPATGLGRVYRGGSYQFGAKTTRCAYRSSATQNSHQKVYGFRCVAELNIPAVSYSALPSGKPSP